MSITATIPAKTTATVLASLTVVTGAAAAATLVAGPAQAMPTEHDATAVITVHNDTDSTMFFDGADDAGAHWVDAPAIQVAPHSSDRITIAANGGAPDLDAELSYHLSGISMAPRGDVTLAAHNHPGAGADTVGTRWSGHFDVASTVQAPSPHAVYDFTIF